MKVRWLKIDAKHFNVGPVANCCVFLRVAGKFITVGWGKKETQFHGSEGKQAAQRKIQVGLEPRASKRVEKKA